MSRQIAMMRQIAKHPTAPDPSYGYEAMKWALLALMPLIVIGNIFVLVQFGVQAIRFLPLLGLIDLGLGFALLSAVAKVDELADTTRRKCKYHICADDYGDAPQHIQKTMRKIFKSAQSLRDNGAHRDGMFGDLDIDRVLYKASEQAVQAAELNVVKRGLQAIAVHADEDALQHARLALRKIGHHLDEIAAELGRAATKAILLSSDITTAKRACEQAEKDRLTADFRDQERSAAHFRIDGAVMQAGFTSRIDTGGIGERVESVAAGYNDATKITNKVLGDDGAKTAEQQPSFLDSAWKTIQAVTGWK